MNSTPLDHPFPERPHRMYYALTNHCNRACPWCSTCSSPSGNSWLSVADFENSFPANGAFQVQLEGGEPTIHPQFWEFVRIARAHPRCSHLVVCTNGVVLPRRTERLRAWVERLGAPLTIKLSVNHHLMDEDAGLIALAKLLRDTMAELGGERLLVINVRLRKGYADDDGRVCEAIEAAGLLPHANVFFLQRYGFAINETGWAPPKPVWDAFSLVNPDGRVYGPDLLARSEGMRELP
ncbi:MAG TPA: radical SAM protein [Planctomycetota bacterium]|nr:radical SAM protein [Planctomycetota bacterium]